MALTSSTMTKLGHIASDFSLPDTISGKTMSLQQLKSDKATVIMFICNHCPFVKYIQHALVDVAKTYQAKGIQFIAISSNDVNDYPDDSPDNMALVAKNLGYPFPYLYDETQAVAKAYQATCTPDFFIYDKSLQCVYRGRFDEASPGKPDTKPTGKDLSQALDSILTNKPVSSDQKPSMGCSIKWK